MEEFISLFISKLESIGIVYQYRDDALEEYLGLEAIIAAEIRDKTLVDTQKWKVYKNCQKGENVVKFYIITKIDKMILILNINYYV